MLPSNVSVCNSVCNLDKSTLKYVQKSIYKSVSTCFVLPSEPICDSNVCSNKLVSASSVYPSKTIYDSNACLSKPITSSNACPSKLVRGSNVLSIKLVRVSSICPSKQTCVKIFVQVKPLALLMSMLPYMIAMFV